MSKIGVIYYNWPDHSFSQFLANAAAIGCSHVEIGCNEIPLTEKNGVTLEELPGTDDELRADACRVREQVEAHGLQVSAFGAFNDFVQPAGKDRDEQVARMRRACIIARGLGEETLIRSEGGGPKDTVPVEENWESMYQCFTGCVPFLEELGVTLAVDNHGWVTNEGDKLLALLQRLDHPFIGTNLDTMNYRWYGNDVETCNRFYQQIAPYVKHTHFKDGFDSREEYNGAALGDGELNLEYALQQLKAVGYDGVYTAEYEGTELDGTGYRKCVQWLQSHV